MINEINKTNLLTKRTDLAYDDYENYPKEQLSDYTLDETIEHNIKILKSIVGDVSSKVINKKAGLYYTIDLSKVNINDTQTLERTEIILANVLKDIIKCNNLENKKAFVVGLGNVSVTPDAIGPIAIDNVVVTRHLELMNNLSDGFSNVCAMSPGVMGTTGIETYEIVKEVANSVDIDYLIVVDALATSSIERINCTIQVTDTGIKPGSGVGNKRKELSYETLGKPVIAIGVPTVVDAATITIDAINKVVEHIYNHTSKDEKEHITKEILGTFGDLSDFEKLDLVKEVLTEGGLNLMVTKKEIDQDVDDLSKVIANGINLALHKGLYNGHSA